MRVLSRSDFILVNAAWLAYLQISVTDLVGSGWEKGNLKLFWQWNTSSSCFSASVFSVKYFISLTSNMNRRNRVFAKDI